MCYVTKYNLVVRFGNKDLAKYPFLKEAFSYITKYDFKLEDLDSKDYLHLIDRASEKIDHYLFFGSYDYQINYSKTHETIVQEEVIVFLISLLLVKSISIEAVTKKFALLESMRFEKYLISDLNTANQDDKTIKLVLYKIFEDLFNTKILLEVDIYNFYKIRINDYLDHPIAFQEKQWNLVNRTLHNGFVYLDGIEIVRLFRNELYLLIIDRIKKMSIDRIPDTITAISKSIKSRWEQLHPSINTYAYNAVTPPCIQHIYDQISKGENLPHPARLLLGTFLIYSNKTLEEMLELFKRLPDFDEKITRYQLEHLAGKRGNSKRYFVPSCEKIKLENLCFETKICQGISNPTQLIRKKPDI
jgi:DNA primase large subunit